MTPGGVSLALSEVVTLPAGVMFELTFEQPLHIPLLQSPVLVPPRVQIVVDAAY